MEYKVYEAASNNDLDSVKNALDGAYGEIPVEDLELALLRAATHGHGECIKVLLENKVNILSKDGCEDTALTLASGAGHEDIVCMLLEWGCHVNYQNSLGKTSMMKACEMGHIGVVKVLLQHGANEKCEDLNKPFDNAMIQSGQKRFATLRTDFPRGYSSLIITVLNRNEGFKDIIKLLLNLKEDFPIEWQDLDGCTVLHHAAKLCSGDVLELLLEAKADVNAKDVWGVTPLMNACAFNQAENVNILLKHGADVINTVCKTKRSALSMAARTACKEIITALLTHGADPNHLDAHKKAPLFIAMSHENYTAMKCLIQAGCDLTITCREMTTWQVMSFLHFAVFLKDKQMIELLYQAGACSNHLLYTHYINEKSADRNDDQVECFELLEHLASNPRSLRSSCRNLIRKTTRKPITESLDSLMLPHMLRDYLLYSDITVNDRYNN